jgi:hypothetical protein
MHATETNLPREHVVEVLHFIYVKRDDNFSMRKYLYETRVVINSRKKTKNARQKLLLDSEKRKPSFVRRRLFILDVTHAQMMR